MILIIDNYDSFVFNLARYFRLLGQEVEVVRNDQITISEIKALNPDALVFSPGPCTPDEAGICLTAIKKLHESIPMLGICLGHQAIVQAFGGEVVVSNRPVHGQTSQINHQKLQLFHQVKNPLQVCRYHSLITLESSMPNCLSIDAQTEDQFVMAVSHKKFPVFGLQFHPESILTESGFRLLSNFLQHASLEFSNDFSVHQQKIDDLEPPSLGVYPKDIPSYY